MKFVLERGGLGKTVGGGGGGVSGFWDLGHEVRKSMISGRGDLSVEILGDIS